MAGRKKGTDKTGGRSEGTPNRTTKEAREFLQAVLFAEFDNIKDSLQKIRKNEGEAKYIDSLNKMLSYILPKQTDVTSGGEKLPRQLNISVTDQETKDILEKRFNADN